MDLKEAVETKKLFKITFWFDRKTQTAFGGVAFENVEVVVEEDVKDNVAKQLLGQEGVITVTMANGAVRYLNLSQILYTDIVEFSKEPKVN